MYTAAIYIYYYIKHPRARDNDIAGIQWKI